VHKLKTKLVHTHQSDCSWTSGLMIVVRFCVAKLLYHIVPVWLVLHLFHVRMTQPLRSKVLCLLWLFRILCLSICKFVLLSDACRTYCSIVQLSNFPPSSLRWCHDIGREQAANKPLLKTVFQVTPLKLKSWFLYFIYLLPFNGLRGHYMSSGIVSV
jgi:hypothetical protein